MLKNSDILEENIFVLVGCSIACYILAITNIGIVLDKKVILIFSFVAMLFSIIDAYEARIMAFEEYNEAVKKHSQAKKLLNEAQNKRCVSKEIDCSIFDVFASNYKTNEENIHFLKKINRYIISIIIIVFIVGVTTDFIIFHEKWGTTLSLISMGIMFASIGFRKKFIYTNRSRLNECKELMDKINLEIQRSVEINEKIKHNKREIANIKKVIKRKNNKK